MSPDYAKEWRLKADADELAARRALQDSKRHPTQAEIACFHAQQCVEKHLKAILALKGQAVPRTHDLLALAALLRRSKVDLRRLAPQLRRLNQYAVEIRYPGAMAAVSDAALAVAAMRRLAALCRKLRA